MYKIRIFVLDLAFWIISKRAIEISCPRVRASLDKVPLNYQQKLSSSSHKFVLKFLRYSTSPQTDHCIYRIFRVKKRAMLWTKLMRICHSIDSDENDWPIKCWPSKDSLAAFLVTLHWKLFLKAVKRRTHQENADLKQIHGSPQLTHSSSSQRNVQPVANAY